MNEILVYNLLLEAYNSDDINIKKNLYQDISKKLPKQGTKEWFETREGRTYDKILNYLLTNPQYQNLTTKILASTVINSSELGLLMNVSKYPMPGKTGYETLLYKKRNPEYFKTYATSFGNNFEDGSAFILSQMLNIDICDIGSIQHPEYPYVRGSVDGFCEYNNKFTIIEIKTPPRRYPNPSYIVDDYYLQMTQNMEIMNCNQTIFCEVHMKPCSVEQLDDEFAFVPEPGYSRYYTQFSRYGLASNASKYKVLLTLIYDYSSSSNKIIDLGALNNKKIFEEWMFDETKIFKPYKTLDTNIDEGYELIEELENMPNVIGYCFTKIFCVNIQIMNRDKNNWYNNVLPTIKKIIDDV